MLTLTIPSKLVGRLCRLMRKLQKIGSIFTILDYSTLSIRVLDVRESEGRAFHFKRRDLIIHCLRPRGGFSVVDLRGGDGGFLHENKISRLKFHQKGVRSWKEGEEGEGRTAKTRPDPTGRPTATKLTRRTAIVKLSRSSLRFHQLANVSEAGRQADLRFQ